MRIAIWAFALTVLTLSPALAGDRPTQTSRARLADGRNVQLRGSTLELLAGRAGAAPAGRYTLESHAIFITNDTGLVIEAVARDGRSLGRNARGLDPNVLVSLIPLPSPHPVPPGEAKPEDSAPGAIPIPLPHPEPRP